MLGVILAGGMLALLPAGDIWLVAVLGATAIIVFALPHSPLAQPWSVLGGYLVAAVASLVAASLVPSFLLAAGLALGATVWCMTRFKCMHPPGGALVLVVVGEGVPTLGHAGHILLVALGNALAILLAALLINNYVLRRSYPQCRTTPVPGPHRGGDPAPSERSGLSHDDIEHAVQSLGSFVDVQEGELVRIFNAAVGHAFERHMATRCGDVMTRNVITVAFGTDLEEAWNLLRRHQVKALPVVDSFRRVVGIVTVADFLRQLDDTGAAGLAVRLQGLLRRTPGSASEKAEVVGQIMTTSVYTAAEDMAVAELVHRLADAGFHHVPIVDERRKLVGMVTQSDLIAALHRRVALAAA
jgi:CBS domain-containing membrane protein